MGPHLLRLDNIIIEAEVATPIDWLLAHFLGWSGVGLLGCLVRLVGCLLGRLIACSVGWLVGCLVGWLVGWRLFDWVEDCIIEWMHGALLETSFRPQACAIPIPTTASAIMQPSTMGPRFSSTAKPRAEGEAIVMLDIPPSSHVLLYSLCIAVHGSRLDSRTVFFRCLFLSDIQQGPAISFCMQTVL